MAINLNDIGAVRRSIGPRLQRISIQVLKEEAAQTKAALILVAEAKKQLARGGTGRVYNLSKPKRTHVASAPGSPPASDLGDLKRSIGMERVGRGIRVGSGLKRAAALEFGHIYRDGRVLKPRPYMRPAFQAASGRMSGAAVGQLRVLGRKVAVLGRGRP